MDRRTRNLIELLLAEDAIEGLDDAGRAELEALLARHPEADRHALERSAATVFLAACEPTEEMPAHLRERLIADAEQVLTRD